MLLDDRLLSRKDINTFNLLAARLRTHFSRNTYEDLRQGICGDLGLPSEFIAWRRLRIMSGLETRTYDCCINSCCCFLGKHKDLTSCPYCKEPRFNSTGKPRRVFRYTPLIPQLRGLFQNVDMVKKLRYRVELEREYKPDIIQDVFDGAHYRSLRTKQVAPTSPYCFFDNPEDIALSLSTYGFTLFKRRRRGLSTAWPIILINNNLSPKIRTRLENVICVGVIPGPRQCKDLNSFLIPLLDELLELEEGVEHTGLSPEGKRYIFSLRAFLIHIFGDIPAVSKLLLMKGHNAFSPCRTCYIEGCLFHYPRVSVYYIPLTHPNLEAKWDCEDLPLRSHEGFLAHAAELDAARTQTARNKLARHYGINGRPVFSFLKSFDLASCAPYDIMHLLFENTVPNMLLHWSGKFKGLGQGTGTYELLAATFSVIGQETAGCIRYMPYSYVGTLPDIAEDGHLYKAEAYSFWIQYIAPIVLKDRLPTRYYKHMLLLREIVITCLEFKLTSDDIEHLDSMVKLWVTQYEKYYYQYSADRLPVCPLTIHAILHIPYYIRQTGPLWASWAFVMERFCGHLLPAVKNRVRPYENLDNYVQRRAQMRIVSMIHNLPALTHISIPKRRADDGTEISSKEIIYPEFPSLILGTPTIKNVVMTKALFNQFTKYFGVVYGSNNSRYLRSRIDRKSVVRYGRFRMSGDGDRIRTGKLIDGESGARDNSFVRYALLPDANAAFRNRRDRPVRENQYGRLLDIYYVVYEESDGTRKPYLLAFIQPCDTRGMDATRPETPVVSYEDMLTPHMVHLNTIEAVIGRVRRGNRWAIVDRNRSGIRTHFVDDNDPRE
ncbi:unnamed protein product [Rhizoctonia solani]|uniref:Transposase family Tnp2 protein n=1 Tax=Rhizoctonia solani TaxID=456999 RepID=A0A8H3H0B3_9AGAM|nr:unnamed protein product [Rhizoctonia solani]